MYDCSVQYVSLTYKFTGKERDTESGNDYFGARYYASSMGRFLSPDPGGVAFSDVSNPQSWTLTFVAEESTFFHRILAEQKSVLIADTNTEEKWRTFKGHRHLRSWLSAPLVASGEYLGCLSVGQGERSP